MSRFDVIDLRQLADQTALSKAPTVPVAPEHLHELLDCWEDYQRLEDDRERDEARIKLLLEELRAGDEE